MNTESAARLVGLLIGATTGWSDDSHGSAAAKLYIERIADKWTDLVVAERAIDNIVRSWTKPSRPPWGALQREYDEQMRRAVMDRAAITPGLAGRQVPPSEGRKAAAAEYARDCKRRGKEPNWTFFDRLAGTVTDDDA
jgi:hypothetical protein